MACLCRDSAKVLFIEASRRDFRLPHLQQAACDALGEHVYNELGMAEGGGADGDDLHPLGAVDLDAAVAFGG